MRLRIDLQYDGSKFFGWQIQPDAISVQQTIQNELTKLNSGQVVDVVGCGRTDTGVHAHHYVAHCDFSFSGELADLKWKLNNMLPSSIAVLKIEKTHDDFHARFDAKWRTYRYFVQRTKNPFCYNYSYLYYTSLDMTKMNTAAQFLLGEHDFTSFSKLHTDVKTNRCEVKEAFWFEQGDQLVFQITANRFLRNMVRATVGTLMLVGEEKIQPKEIAEILKKKDRGEAGRSVPGEGLFLWEIVY